MLPNTNVESTFQNIERLAITIWLLTLVPFFLILDLETCNNSIEAWHKAFEMDVKKHPTIFKLINQFRIEQKNTELLYAQIKSGDTYRRKASEIEKRKKIFSVCSKFSKSDLDNFLEEMLLLI